MRCLVLICLCLAVASATSFNKLRFHRLLNAYQRNRLGGSDRYDITGRLGGLGDLDEIDTDRFDGLGDSNEWDDEIDTGRFDRFDRFDRSDRLDRLGDFDKYDTDRTGDYDRFDTTDDVYGSDDIDEDVDEIRREKLSGRCSKYGDEKYLDLEDEMTGSPYERKESFDKYERTGVPCEKSQVCRKFGRVVSKDIETASTLLASRLYKQVKDERDDKNTVVSPVSIQLALAALVKGARGETKRQIERVIAGRVPTEKRHQVFKTILRSLKGLGSNMYSSPIMKRTKITPITGIFITHTTPAQQQFIQIVKGSLNVLVKKCDFQRQPQQCRQMINRWVSQKTLHKMPQIVPKDAITDNTKMIVVNALQLKANWGRQMRKCITKPSPFYPLESEKVKIVEMLQTRGVFKYYEDELVKIVGVPTEQKELTLYVIVPKHKDGLTTVEKMHLQDGEELKQLLLDADKRVKRVDVQLPKFEIKHKVDVRRTLLKQGVVDPFDTKRADFSGITGVSPLHINEYENEYTNEYDNEEDIDNINRMHHRRSNLYPETGMFEESLLKEQGLRGIKNVHLNKFIHQATIKITENGITSATGTGSPVDELVGGEEDMYHTRKMRSSGFGRDSFEDVIGLRTSSIGEHRVKADRAFAFVLKHNPTQQVLLIGRVIDAAQKHLNRVPLSLNNVDQL